jgi:hypothetical protein
MADDADDGADHDDGDDARQSFSSPPPSTPCCHKAAVHDTSSTPYRKDADHDASSPLQVLLQEAASLAARIASRQDFRAAAIHVARRNSDPALAAMVPTPERATPPTILPQESVVSETIRHPETKMSAQDGHAAKSTSSSPQSVRVLGVLGPNRKLSAADNLLEDVSDIFVGSPARFRDCLSG